MTVYKNRARRLQKLFARMQRAHYARLRVELVDELAAFEAGV